MIFHETGLAGCVLIEPERVEDERGFFARTFDAEELRRRGLNPNVAQVSISYTEQAGTLRGLHFQVRPHQEAKLVRCLRGCVYDVVVDLRPDAATYLEWRAYELDDADRVALYVPEGLAHGFLTLASGTEMQYQISIAYVPGAARGIPWDDPAVGVVWPRQPACMSARDRAWSPVGEQRRG